MIVVRLSGGIGNQMFQYVLIKLLEHLGYNVRIDLSSYRYICEHKGPEIFEAFDISKYNYITKLLNTYYLREKKINKIVSISHKIGLNFITPWKLRHIFPNNYLSYSHLSKYSSSQAIIKSIDQLKDIDNKIFDGIFCDPQIKEVTSIVKSEFKFNSQVDDFIDKNLLKLINNTNSVSIHVRKGDFQVQNIVLPLSYYHKSINEISRLVKRPVFFVFSDDKDLNIDSFGIDAHIIPYNKNAPSYVDMYLMSKCMHNIIANSTYSWWAAWLNENINKIVITPKYWYKEDLALTCDDWTIIE